MSCKGTAERCQKKADTMASASAPEPPPPPPPSTSPDVDPHCLPDSPIVVTLEQCQEAAKQIASGIICTPCRSSHFTKLTEMNIYFKCDFQQYTGCFKERGARYALMKLPEEQKKRGAVAASMGNYAQGVCYHGTDLGIPVTVVMPVIAAIMKVANCRNLGGNVILEGNDLAEAKKIAMRMASEQGLAFINGYDHPDVIAGQGSIGLEILEQVPDVEAILVPVGGGGQLAGICAAVKSLKPNVLIYGVETECTASFTNSIKEGKVTTFNVRPTLADGLAVATVGYNAFATAQPLVDKMVVVTEESVSLAILRLLEMEKMVVEGAGAVGLAPVLSGLVPELKGVICCVLSQVVVTEESVSLAILRLLEMEKMVVEGAGAVGLAAVLSGLVPELKGKKVVICLCGGNIDSTMLGRCVDRGLATDGRLLRIQIIISDRPGGLAEFCLLVSSLGVSVKHVLQQRAWIKANVFTVEMTAICEVMDRDHAKQLKTTLNEKYEDVKFTDFAE